MPTPLLPLRAPGHQIRTSTHYPSSLGQHMLSYCQSFTEQGFLPKLDFFYLHYLLILHF